MTEHIQNHFPALKNYTYLNTAAAGLLSEKVYDYRQKQNELFLEKGSVFRDEKAEVLAETREGLADFFSAEAKTIALTPNFSFGFNVLLEGLPKTSKILLLKDDYPSINGAVESWGFECCYATINAQLEEEIYKTVEQEKPDVFAFSTVQYINGIKIDLEFIKKLKQDFPDLIIIGDGTQFCGTESFDFSKSGFDVMGASAYKWLNSGFGNAFFMLKPEMQNRIFPKTKGYGSSIGKYKQAENALIGKFEPGHLNTADIGSISAGLQFQKEIGRDFIAEKIKYLKNEAFQAFKKRGLLEKAVVNRKEHSPIFNIKSDGVLFEKLHKNNILCSQRGNGIRVSFHYYNTEGDLEKLLGLID
jgi:selenocysteine lyase/cysteine desulfurase